MKAEGCQRRAIRVGFVPCEDAKLHREAIGAESGFHVAPDGGNEHDFVNGGDLSQCDLDPFLVVRIGMLP
jgi:hypothetical protein